MSDIFGYNKDIKEREIISSDYAAIDIGEGRLGLVQQWTAGYQHRVEPRFETGSSALYLVNGQPMGNISVNSLVGRRGFLAGFGADGSAACGDLKTVIVSADGDGQCGISEGGSLSFSGTVIQSIQITAQAGNLDVAQSANFIAASLG